MKKILSLTAALLAVLMLASCSGTPNDETVGDTTAAADTTAAPELAYKDAADLLTMIWNDFGDDQKFYVGGGNTYNPETMVENAPAKFVALADTDYDANLGLPVAEVAKIDDAAAMFHGMNVNNFTCAAFHYTNSDDAAAAAEALKANILARQWMCGFPEKLVIITLPGNYVISMWGIGEGCVDLFASKATTLIDGAQIVVDQAI